MKSLFYIIIGLSIGIGFIYSIYHFLPLGVAIAITGGCLATIKSERRALNIVGMTGGWIFVGGVVYSFLKGSWLNGIISMIIGMMAYSYTKK